MSFTPFKLNLFLEENNEDDEDASFDKKMAVSSLSLEEELAIESKYGIDTPLAGSVLSLHPGTFNHNHS